MKTTLGIAVDCSENSTQKDDDTWEGLASLPSRTPKNKFIAIGCDTFAYLSDGKDNSSIGTGCLSYCNEVGDTVNGTCDGIGCCEAFIPAGLKAYETTVGSMYQPRRNLSFNPCTYAFLAERKSFNFSSSYLMDFRNKGTLSVPAVVDWTIGNQTCKEAKKT
ncbi:hypothetical protein MKW92_013373 [Papaver armeniacum]|nr:hypothetical protein MKW92_013373 [Papaver armeniacum]